jgi:mono/diheme cytochrome c family protein
LLWLALALVLSGTAGIVQAQAPIPAFTAREERVDELPEGRGREETFSMCTACHAYRLVSNQGMSRDKWDETLTWMTEGHNMPALSGPERKLILDYLSNHHPPKAPSQRGGFKNPFAP